MAVDWTDFVTTADGVYVSMEEAEERIGHIDNLIMRLYQARKASALAKKARAEARSNAGDCEYESSDEEGPCWIRQDGDVCEACAAAIPATEEYWRKSDKAGGALRAVMHEGKRLSLIRDE